MHLDGQFAGDTLEVRQRGEVGANSPGDLYIRPAKKLLDPAEMRGGYVQT